MTDRHTERKTEQHPSSQQSGNTAPRNTIRKSIGAGISSLTNSGKEFYVLEHKSNSQNFKAGQQQEVIVNHIELGRDPRCAIRFGEADHTVSRRHAAIFKQDANWVLMNLSQTNQTLLNGRPVIKQWYLSSGDEIQLSLEGPRLGFIIPSNNKMGSLGLGVKLSAFRQQALRPYKQALAIVGVLLLLISAGSAYIINELYWTNIDLRKTFEETATALRDSNQVTTDRASELQQKNTELAKSNEEVKRRLTQLSRQLRSSTGVTQQPSSTPPPLSGASTLPPDIRELYEDIYYVTVFNIRVLQGDGSVTPVENLVWSGTGFLTKEGRFITARHVVEMWYYPINPEENKELVLINILLHNYGARVDGDMIAESSSGQKLKFRLSDFKIDRSGDQRTEIPIEEQPHIIKHALNNSRDIAYISAPSKGKLTVNGPLSESLQAAQELFILGYPLGIGTSDRSNMAPIYSTASVARPGLEQGSIITSNISTDHGNSGGPVFVKMENGYEVVGVVSGSWGENIGRIVPIATIE